jgi:hypothetical protein
MEILGLFGTIMWGYFGFDFACEKEWRPLMSRSFAFLGYDNQIYIKSLLFAVS